MHRAFCFFALKWNPFALLCYTLLTSGMVNVVCVDDNNVSVGTCNKVMVVGVLFKAFSSKVSTCLQDTLKFAARRNGSILDFDGQQDRRELAGNPNHWHFQLKLRHETDDFGTRGFSDFAGATAFIYLLLVLSLPHPLTHLESRQHIIVLLEVTPVHVHVQVQVHRQILKQKHSQQSPQNNIENNIKNNNCSETKRKWNKNRVIQEQINTVPVLSPLPNIQHSH